MNILAYTCIILIGRHMETSTYTANICATILLYINSLICHILFEKKSQINILTSDLIMDGLLFLLDVTSKAH